MTRAYRAMKNLHLEKFLNTKFRKNQSVGSRVVQCEWADRRNDRQTDRRKDWQTDGRTD